MKFNLTKRYSIVLSFFLPPFFLLFLSSLPLVQIMIETQQLPGVAGQDQREAILKNPDNLAVCTVVKLLRTIAVNGFRYMFMRCGQMKVEREWVNCRSAMYVGTYRKVEKYEGMLVYIRNCVGVMNLISNTVILCVM